MEWDEYFSNILNVSKDKSPCSRLKVSCLLVKDNRIISHGFNGFLTNQPHNSILEDNHEVGTIHAEANALMYCSKYGISCNDAIAYITHYPCINCIKLLYMSGIRRIKYMDDYNNDTNIEKLGILDQTSNNSISITKLKRYTSEVKN